METQLDFDNQEQMEKLCGINDRNLPYLELLTGCDLSVKGTKLFASSTSQEPIETLVALMGQLKKTVGDRDSLCEPEIFMEYQNIRNGFQAVSWNPVLPDRDVIVVQKKMIYAKGSRQEEYIRAMEKDQIVFATGPAGTGKTFLAVAHALSMMLSGKRQKLVLTRPVVEAGESLGFLPGDLSQKISPYLRPLYDAMEGLIGPLAVRKLEENGSIEVAPLAYMRGRSLQNAVVLLDEAQNTTKEQMQMFLTRIGENASAIVTGDISQTDLPRGKVSGLSHALSILEGIQGISMIRFSSHDVVRGRIVQKIIDAYALDRQRKE